MAKKIQGNVKEQMIRMISQGLDVAFIAEVLNVSESTVYHAKMAVDAAKISDYETLRKEYSRNITMVEAVCKHFHVDINKVNPQPEPPAVRQPVPPTAPAEPNASELIIGTLIQLVREQNELLTQFMNVVIPKWANDIINTAQADTERSIAAMGVKLQDVVNSVNANADIMNKELQRIGNDVDGIRARLKFKK